MKCVTHYTGLGLSEIIVTGMLIGYMSLYMAISSDCVHAFNGFVLENVQRTGDL